MASRDTSISPSIARGDRDLLTLGLALPGASQGPLKSPRHVQLTCWGLLLGWHCGKTCALRGQLRLTRPCPAISESLLVNTPMLMPPRAAVQEPMRHSLEDIRKGRGSQGPQTSDQPQAQPLLSARPGVPAGGSGPFTCCQEHISAIRESSRGFGRISLSFPRAFNKSPPSLL